MEKEKVSGKEFADIMNPPAPVAEEPEMLEDCGGIQPIIISEETPAESEE